MSRAWRARRRDEGVVESSALPSPAASAAYSAPGLIGRQAQRRLLAHPRLSRAALPRRHRRGKRPLFACRAGPPSLRAFEGLLLRAIEALAATAATIRHQSHHPHQSVEKAMGHGAMHVHPTACRTARRLPALAVTPVAFHALSQCNRPGRDRTLWSARSRSGRSKPLAGRGLGGGSRGGYCLSR